MSKCSDKAPENAKVLEVAKRPIQTEAQTLAWVAMIPETHAAFVINAFQSNTVDRDVNLLPLIEALHYRRAASTGNIVLNLLLVCHEFQG